MILTTCAACAAPLAHDAPRCVRCKSRYCNRTCQMDHWRRGHKQMCKKIHRGGNAEQYHADKKYKEAVAVAVEACKEDTKGQTCYICMEGDTKEGLVRGCACGDRESVASGNTGIAHLSCLARQARILREEAEEKNLGQDAMTERWRRWDVCALCKQRYHGVVGCALAWACWKTYVGRPETDGARISAMMGLGNGLSIAEHHEEALSVQEAELSLMQRIRAEETHIVMTTANIAHSYQCLGRHKEALALRREMYARAVALKFPSKQLIIHVNNLAVSLKYNDRYEEAKCFLREKVAEFHRTLGADNADVIKLRWNYAKALWDSHESSYDDVVEATTILEELSATTRRVLGPLHPYTKLTQENLEHMRSQAVRRDAAAGLIF